MSSIEQALLARAYPRVLAARAHEIRDREASKGCRSEIAPYPVHLEPPYQPIFSLQDVAESKSTSIATPEQRGAGDRMTRMQIWISPQQRCEWNRSELFLKQLSYARHRIALEVLGNRKRIMLQMLCHYDDARVVRTAFLAQFELCALTHLRDDDLLASVPPRAWRDVGFHDYYPPPPYSHLMTRPEELRRSPYTTLFAALAGLPASALGLYQVVFAPVAPAHDWHRNVQTLLDLEYQYKLLCGLTTARHYPQQAPSADLRQMAMDVEVKSHNDKPFFAAALRVAVINGGAQTESLLRSLALIGSVIQHGGRPLSALTSADYRSCLSPAAISSLFMEGLAHRSGFLLNSEELTSLVHIPSTKDTEHHHKTMNTLETLPATEAIAEGTPIGTCAYADELLPVCIPDSQRRKHTHLIGVTGSGKSTVLEAMMLSDIRRGHGTAVLDPHGRLVERLLYLIPDEFVDRVIYIDPGDPDWVPLWNPLQPIPGQDVGRIADDLVRAFKKIVTGWGDRLEYLLRQAFFATLSMPGSTFLEVFNLMRNKTKRSRAFREQILQVVDNEVAREFWLSDFERYGKDDLGPPKNKLSKLLLSGTASLMLSQPESRFTLRDVMEKGQVLLVNLSTIGSQVREVLGCFLLELMRLTAISRNSAEHESLLPFHVYCDEAQMFITDALEDLIAQTRKFNVSLTLAHQYMSQFNTRKTDALSGVGSTIIFQVDRNDAQYLTKDLLGEAEVDDLRRLEVGEAITRIGNHVVRVRTDPPLEIRTGHSRDQIIARSRERYYARVDEVRTTIKTRRERWMVEPSTMGRGVSTNASTERDAGASPPGTGAPVPKPEGGDFDYEVF